MLKGEALRNAAVLILCVILSFAVAEVAVRFFVSVRDVGPSFTVYDPVLGKRIKSGLVAERITPEFRMRLSTNSLGFRGPEPDGSSRRPIVFLGDSFTLGYGVSDGEEFPARINSELRRQHGDAAPPVVNAGIGDSGNGFWLKFLRNRADAMQPKIVVMQLLDNDFADNVNEKLFTLGPGDSLQELAIPAPGPLRMLQTAIESIPGLSYSYIVGLLRQVRAPVFVIGTAPAADARQVQSEPADRLTIRIVEEAIRICRSRGWKVLGLLVGLPDERATSMNNLFSRYAVPTVVVPGKDRRPDLYYRIDGHWHAEGHAYAAKRVLDALTTLELTSQ